MKTLTPRSVWCWLREYWLNPRRTRLWLVAVFVLYTVLGFLVLPWVATSFAITTVADDLDRDLRIGAVHTNPFTLTLEVERLALNDVDGRALVGFEHLFVDLAWSSVLQGTPVIPTARVQGAHVYEEQFASGQTRFTRLLSDVRNAPPRGSEPAAAGDEPRAKEATVPIALDEIDASLDDFVLAEDAVSPFQVNGRLELGGAFTFDGELQLRPAVEISGEFEANELALAVTEPFAQRFANIRLDSGRLSAQGELHSGPDAPLTVAGSARIDALDIREREGGEDVVSWQTLAIDEIDFSVGERLLELSVIRIEEPSVRVFIAEDRSTNLGDLLVEPPATPEATSGEGAGSFETVIGGVHLDGGVLAFSDHSLPLPFATRVHKLSGGVSQLSAGLQEPARIDLEGQIADYGQARINGELDPWSPLSRTRVDLVFENLDIPDLTPYVVPFAGRRVAAGRMDLDLGYALDNGQLDAQNHIVLRDLQLGERFQHPGATDLPLGLAIALLKNSEGIITVDIPVQGNVNDPEFSFGPAIRDALAGVLQDIISSPFTLLAAIVGGDPEELAAVSFDPGSSAIEPAQRERLDQLRMALDERPELALELPAPYAPEVDRPALQRQQARAAMLERLEQAGADVANPSLSAGETSATVAAMFVERYPQQALADVRQRFTVASDGETEFNARAYREHLAAEVTAAQSITEGDLEALAQARANAVRQFLLDNNDDAPTIASDRLRWIAPREVEADGAVVLELSLAAE